ncbi:NADP-dependent 3-hydroxy acid dehydrogenase YdfG [Nocardia tenerifensis]|uniref:NADP-dependent 3-hydroxy acid dehydrogenase YdfG n=1 Tax=Nocardia tenerifensis TaxID=228006 RepID=A0A318KCX8_9NOCA|nr:SDR family NAD(P)-dependent oxidoreductase [Nocardia tenerifensis]PXX70785.1 NADP-dependent 3-hydroxy acid dehydrogenase YdfG [Nocardia tenerifensis]
MTSSPVALITGGSSGLGAATARLLLEQGHRVTVTGRDRARLDRFAEDCGSPDGLLSLVADAADPEATQCAVDATLQRYGRLDAVVANAGFAVSDSIVDGDPFRWREMVLTNVLGPAVLAWASMDALKESHGRIILVGSVAGLVHAPGSLYGATKWAVTGLAENIRRAVTGLGVGVTLVAPGRMRTNFWDGLGGAPEVSMLTGAQVAESIVWAVRQPAGVDVNTLVVRPIGQPV